MQPSDLVDPHHVSEAIELSSVAGSAYLAGGTNLVDFLRTGVMQASTLIDIERLPLRGIDAGDEGLRIGALTRMSDLAADADARNQRPSSTVPLRPRLASP